MRILLTGHLGYIGTVLTPMLLAEGHDVVGLDADLYRRCTFLERIAQVPSIRKDLRDVTPDDVRGFDAVLHLAALSNDPLGNLNPGLTEDINWRASVRLAELSKEAGGGGGVVFLSGGQDGGGGGAGVLHKEGGYTPPPPQRAKRFVGRG